MRSDHVKGHMQVHQKYSPTNDTPQSAEDICNFCDYRSNDQKTLKGHENNKHMSKNLKR